MRVLPERQVNSAYFTFLIVTQVSAWQHRHFRPAVSFATSTASAGAAALFCSSAPTAPLQVPSLLPSLLCSLGCCAVLQHPVPARSAPASVPAARHPGAQASRGTGGRGAAEAARLPCSPWLGDRGAAAPPRAPCPQPSPLAGQGRRALSVRSDARGRAGLCPAAPQAPLGLPPCAPCPGVSVSCLTPALNGCACNFSPNLDIIFVNEFI